MKPLIRLSFISVLFGLLASPCQAQSEQTGGSPLKVELSISHYQAVKHPVAKSDRPALPLEIVEIPEQNGRIRVLTGEPIILNARITNLSSETVTLDLANELHPWLMFSVQNAEGKKLTPIPYRRYIIYQDGIYAASLTGQYVIVLLPGAHFDQRFVVTQQFALSYAGRYRLTTKASVPFYWGDVGDATVWKAKPNGILSDTQKLSITATQARLRTLETIAQNLELRVESRQIGTEIAATALFSMPEYVALPVWEKSAVGSTCINIISTSLQDLVRRLLLLFSDVS